MEKGEEGRGEGGGAGGGGGGGGGRVLYINFMYSHSLIISYKIDREREVRDSGRG